MVDEEWADTNKINTVRHYGSTVTLRFSGGLEQTYDYDTEAEAQRIAKRLTGLVPLLVRNWLTG